VFYLILQMLVPIALAIVFGVAVGWLLHHAANRVRMAELRGALAQRSRLLEQARADVSMLTDDYDELRERNHQQFDKLEAENRRLPALESNLEKSQLLVRQMIQRHEVEVRELNADKSTLNQKLASAQQRLQLSESIDAGNEALIEKAPEPNPEADSQASSQPAPDPVTPATRDSNTDLIPEPAGELDSDTEPDSIAVKPDPVQPARRVAASATPVCDDSTTRSRSRIVSKIASSPIRTTGPTGSWASKPLEVDAHRDSVFSSASSPSARDPLFVPVDRQDDLQQIIGIGPLTEKALNDLGITSYPQLAELRRFEIERIADALQIVPETIERDDWVGNARRQLEEVLEEL